MKCFSALHLATSDLFFEEVESDLLEILGFAVFTQTYPKSDLGMVRDPERDSEGESCDVGIRYHGWSQG